MPGAQPHAHAYCGHQFGSFAGQLGDGAAMYLGEVEGPSGRWVGRRVPYANKGCSPCAAACVAKAALVRWLGGDTDALRVRVQNPPASTSCILCRCWSDC